MPVAPEPVTVARENLTVDGDDPVIESIILRNALPVHVSDTLALPSSYPLANGAPSGEDATRPTFDDSRIEPNS